MNFKQGYVISGVVFLILILLSLIRVPTVVLGEQHGTPRLSIPLWQEKVFTVEYLHSVNKTPVQEHFASAPGNRIVLTGTEFRSLGVGTPFLPEEGQLVNDQGVYSLSGMDRSFDKLHFIFLSFTRHTLIAQGKQYAFADYFEPGQIVEIRITDYTISALANQKIFTEGRSLWKEKDMKN